MWKVILLILFNSVAAVSTFIYTSQYISSNIANTPCGKSDCQCGCRTTGICVCNKSKSCCSNNH